MRRGVAVYAVSLQHPTPKGAMVPESVIRKTETATEQFTDSSCRLCGGIQPMNTRLVQRCLLAVTWYAGIGFNTAAYAGSGEILLAREPVPNEYIVQIAPDSLFTPRVAADALAATHGGTVRAVFSNVVQGFLVTMTPQQAERMNSDPLVEVVEESAVVRVATTQTIPEPGPGVAPASQWALDRLDQPSPSAPRLDGQYKYCSTGAGVRAYVIDTGVKVLTEFSGRVDRSDEEVGSNKAAQEAAGYEMYDCWSRTYSAAAGHGTAVAGVLGSETFGVAKDVTLVDAKAFDCYGDSTTSRVLITLDWIPTDPKRGTARSVINMSFSWLSAWAPDNSAAAKRAINSLVDDYNMVAVAAAGNEDDNVYWYFPASATRAITVAGTQKAADTRWTYSNYGSYVDLYAPAQYIESLHIRGDDLRSEAGSCFSITSYPQDSCTSGTSFAAPLVSGVVARYLQTRPSATRDQVLDYIEAESAANTGINIVDPAAGKLIPLLSMTDCP